MSSKSNHWGSVVDNVPGITRGAVAALHQSVSAVSPASLYVYYRNEYGSTRHIVSGCITLSEERRPRTRAGTEGRQSTRDKVTQAGSVPLALSAGDIRPAVPHQ